MREPMRCICGGSSFEPYGREAYEVSKAGETKLAGSKMSLGRCSDCGVVRQMEMPFSSERGFLRHYQGEYAPTDSEYGAKDYAHDLKVAQMRCDSYRIRKSYQGKVLDVGSGSGAFVEEARRHGAEAYGCEIGKYHYASEADDRWVYRGMFEGMNFPTDHFDMVTCHDVLEHVLDPAKFVAELFRVAKQSGTCMVDFPHYFVEHGSHHWKRFEHIWYFNEDQLRRLFQSAGFRIDSVSSPIPSKLLFSLIKPLQVRPTILVPPGIGDSYWSLVKMEAFLKREGLGLPDVSIVCPREKKYNGHLRAFPFLEMIPFLNATWKAVEGNSPKSKPIWKEAYLRAGNTIFRNVDGNDYFIAYNGNLRVGKRLEEVDPDLECNWFPPMFVSLEQESYRRGAEEAYGKYILFYFVFQGTYVYWTKEFPVPNLIKSITEIVDRTGYTPVFAGAAWDAENDTLSKVKKSVPGCVDLVGRTSVEQLFGLIRGAQAVIGFPSGLTIMSVVMRQKTLILWNDFYSRQFVRNGFPPSTWRKTYHAENTLNMTSDYFAGWAVERITGQPCSVERPPLAKQQPIVDIDPAESPERVLTPKSLLRKKSLARLPAILGTVACVLRSGGDFDERYVRNLHAMVARNLTRPFRFVCLTDLPEVDGCEAIRLANGFPGWWAKVELFRSGLFDTERVVYFDLDTVILGNIDKLFDLDDAFYGLRPWNRANRERGQTASGVMVWRNGSCSFIYDEFRKQYMEQVMSDQAYITERLRSHGIQWTALQDVVPGIRSYKRECRDGLIGGTRIVCFHGRPRLHECRDKWVMEAWG